MASVFLSYDREDVAVARSVALALEKAGHSVWWDRHIKGGAQYSDEIEQALKRAKAVVVLWSPTSVKSAWVRDEAAAGRDSGRLVPALIKAVEPPMGFRQYQTIDLSRWKGRAGTGSFKELLHGIESLSPGDRAEPAPAKIELARRPASVITAALLIVALVTVAAWLVVPRIGRADVPVVSVAAADMSRESQQLARELFVKLGPLQTIGTSPIKLIDRDNEDSADFTFEIGGSTAASQAAANITLTGRDRVLLWSKDFETPRDKIGDLRQQVAVSAGRVLECATQALSSGKVDQPTVKIFLNGCASLEEGAGTDFRALVPIFRQVTEAAPQFEGGWANLLLSEAYVVGWETLPKNSPEAVKLQSDISAVRKRYPDMPEVYWAEYLLAYEDLPRKSEIIEGAVKAHPENPLLLSVYSGHLQSVGRGTEAVAKAKRAAELSPLSPGNLSQYINVLGWTGRSELALAELNKAEKVWPNASILLDSRWRYHLRYGDPKEALRITRTGVNPSYADQETYLLARIDPSPANVDRAVALAKANVGRVPRATGLLLQILADFGRDEEVFRIALGSKIQDLRGSSDAFFRPPFKRVRQDPRFIQVAARLGYIAHWQKTGKWPDFCFEPDLPYDCKAEAAKLG